MQSTAEVKHSSLLFHGANTIIFYSEDFGEDFSTGNDAEIVVTVDSGFKNFSKR